ncbi:MAG: hypothetical protein A2V88_10015 [Elusimicrobia bacterium RBG_16_66_12]|nr:MAG: hypothetical protein A2V88_10015 [Elusimicrobia bacterium RBG_16_66_12]
MIATGAAAQIAAARSSESSKADSGLRFLESGKGQAGVQEPPAVRAGASASHASGLAASPDSKRTTASKEIPAPAVATSMRKEAERSAWSKAKIVSAICGGVAGAVVGLPAIGSGIPVAAAVLAAGTIAATGVVIGYGIAALAERAYNARSN